MVQREKRKPAAFMSYTRIDDKYGHLTEFRKRLSDEVHVQTGEEFPIFQDRKDIQWGQNWRERVEESLNVVTFLIPIITPCFFTSQGCRDELQQFIDREKELNRNDLILPVYYIDCPLLNDEAKQATDELARVIAARQWADWRELRNDPLTFPQVQESMTKLAVQIRDALERVQTSQKTVIPGSTQISRQSAREPTPSLIQEAESVGKSQEVTRRMSAKTEPLIRVVDPMHRGDHLTITEAIEKAKPGDRILVRPGLYQEGLVIDKPLEIIGDGGPGEVVVQATGKDAILFQTTMGRVANLTLRQIGGGDWFGVNIAQGRLELEGCDITSQGLACVAIHGGADPRLRRNHIYNANQRGVLVYDNGQGVLEDNNIFGNTLSGVGIHSGSNPTLRRNRIHDNKQAGVYILDNSQGTLEDNNIFGNTLFGVGIESGGNPTLRRNRIHNNKRAGVFIYRNGQGVLEDNDIFSNALSGVEIKSGSNPTLCRNRINKNSYQAVRVYEGGGGRIEDNDLRNNAQGAWDISADSEPNLKRARNTE